MSMFNIFVAGWAGHAAGAAFLAGKNDSGAIFLLLCALNFAAGVARAPKPKS